MWHSIQGCKLGTSPPPLTGPVVALVPERVPLFGHPVADGASLQGENWAQALHFDVREGRRRFGE